MLLKPIFTVLEGRIRQRFSHD